MGSSRDQKLDFAQNKTLNESNSNRIEVHLFQVFKRNEYIYQGKVRLVDNHYKEQQVDAEDNVRSVWIFPLKQVVQEDALIPQETLIGKEQQREKMAKKLSDEELKNKVKKIEDKPGRRKTTSTVYERNSVVDEYAKRMTKRICQLCEEAAPFKNKKESHI